MLRAANSALSVSGLTLAAALSLSPPARAETAAAASWAAAATPSAEEARAFVAKAEKEAFDFSVEAGKVAWVNATYITDDTDALAAAYGARGTEMAVRYALDAARYQRASGLDAETKRKLDIMRSALVLPAPTRPGAAAEPARIPPSIVSSAPVM